MGAITEARPVPTLRDAPRTPSPNPRSARRRTRRHRRGRLLLLLGAAAIAVLVAALVAAAGVVWFRVDRRHVDLVGSTHGVTYLLVGSDSRAFVSSATDRAHFGAPTGAGGEHADIVLLIRKVGDRVSMLDIPRDLVLLAPGDVPTRYALTFSGGLQSLADVTCHSLGVPVDHVAVVHFDGLRRSIDAVGGVDMTFGEPLRDRVTVSPYRPAAGTSMVSRPSPWSGRGRPSTKWTGDGSRSHRPRRSGASARRAVLGALGARSAVSLLSPWSSMRKLLAFVRRRDRRRRHGAVPAAVLREGAAARRRESRHRLPAHFTPGAVPVAVATAATAPAIRRFTGPSGVCSSRFPSLSAGGNS